MCNAFVVNALFTTLPWQSANFALVAHCCGCVKAGRLVVDLTGMRITVTTRDNATLTTELPPTMEEWEVERLVTAIGQLGAYVEVDWHNDGMRVSRFDGHLIGDSFIKHPPRGRS